MKFFLSYASDHDQESAKAIKNELEALDPPHEVYIDYESLRKADDTDFEINKMLESVDAVLYLLTVSSVRSFWCGKEIGYAQCLGKPIVPIAGPGITGEFIKSHSIPFVSGLKWVNWWEHDRAQRIVEALTRKREIIRVMRADEADSALGVSESGDFVVVGVKNTRAFDLTDVSICCQVEIALKARNRSLFEMRDRPTYLLLEAGDCVRNGSRLSDYRDMGRELTRERLVPSISDGSVLLEHCVALVMVRFCIGGQHYLSQLSRMPFIEVCSKSLREALVSAAAFPKTKAS